MVAVADEIQATAAMKKLNRADAGETLLDEAVFGAVEISNVAKRVNGEEVVAEEDETEGKDEDEDEVGEDAGSGAVTDGGNIFIDTNRRRKVPPAFPTTGKPTFNASAPEAKVGCHFANPSPALPCCHNPPRPPHTHNTPLAPVRSYSLSLRSNLPLSACDRSPRPFLFDSAWPHVRAA